MFCIQCGLELSKQMQFCPRCGTKIDANIPSSGQSKTSQDAPQAIILPLLSQQVRFPNSIELYIDLRSAFQELAVDLSRDFFEHFYSTYYSMDQFIQQFPKDFPALFAQATDLMNDLLSQIEIFGVTQQELTQYTNKYCCNTYREFHDIQEQYQQILYQQESMREYREARKDSRGRVVGGGFGLRGAAKGIITAGAINATTGALHSLGNALGNMGSAVSASNAKDRLFRSGIAGDLTEAIQEDILGVHYVVIDLIAARTGQKITRFTHEHQAQADKIYDDLEQHRISSNQEAAAVLQMLKTFPFAPNYYKLAVRLFPDRLDEMRDFARFFEYNIDKFYGEVKRTVDSAVQLLLEYQTEYVDLLTIDLGFQSEDVAPLTTDLEDMLSYFGDIFEFLGEDGFYFLPADHNKGQVKLQNAKVSYAHYGQEQPLILYDSTLSRSGKEGFLVTNQRIYLKHGSQIAVLPIEQIISDIEQRCDDSNQNQYLYFGEHRVHLLHSGKITQSELLEDFLELLFALIIFLRKLHPKAELLSEALKWYLQLPHAAWSPSEEKEETPAQESPDSHNVCYCFECGAENDADDRYCFECGAELI